MGAITSVLFVCTGNICRSPTADGVMRHMAAEAGLDMRIDSCGTHGYHAQEAPDSRSVQTASNNGVDLSPLRARKLEAADFKSFDLLLAMDQGHLNIMRELCPPEHLHKLRLFLGDQDVPDPYYGDLDGFDHVYDLCVKGCEDILRAIS